MKFIESYTLSFFGVVSAYVCLFVFSAVVGAGESAFLLLRAENLTVLPTSRPVLYVRVANVGRQPIDATVSIDVPPSWEISELSKEVELSVGEAARVGFPVADGDVSESNSYPVTMTAEGEGRVVQRHQRISVASAPYFKPEIDGDPGDWKDAIPVTFSRGSRDTTIATYWNRRQFSMLVSVEEARQVKRGDAGCFDAVQVALAPRGTVTGRSVDQEACRFEYLVFGDADGSGDCCQLAQPGLKLAEAARCRSLDPLSNDKAKVAMSRIGGVTHYEFSLPLADVRQYIRPSEGREFYLSVLVHDPDGTGVRDWGEAAGLWENERNRLAWSDWEGAKWGSEPPMDCRTEWGMCSSKY